MATMQGKIVLGAMMAGMMAKMDKAGGMAEMAKGEGAQQMLGGFSVLRLASMIGGFMNIEITKEQLLDLNKKLNKIKKKSK